MSISDAQAKVRAFQRKYGEYAPDMVVDVPEVSLGNHINRRRWISDELDELNYGRIHEDIPEIADAYVDIIYFALGGLVELGIDGGPLFDAVHAANMQKVKLPGVAKIAKPEGWTPPDIAALIEAQRNRK